MLGGLLLAAVDTEGRPGVAWRARHARPAHAARPSTSGVRPSSRPGSPPSRSAEPRVGASTTLASREQREALWPAPVARAPVDVRVELPGSKSLTNRALVLAALADGPSVVRRALRSRDTELMAAALSRARLDRRHLG